VNEPEPAAETLASGDSPQAAGAKTGPEPAAEAASDSPAEAAPEPTAKADAEPTAEAASEPTTEAASEPTADAASEPTTEAEKPAVSSNPPAETPEPATESPEPTTAANEQAAESTDAPTEVTQPEVTTVASEPDTAAEASEADATTEASEPDATTVASEPEPPTASEPDTAAEATETVVEAAVEPADDAPDAGTEVASALRRLRLAIVDSAYPLVLPSAEDARRVSAALLAQLDDYLLPRLARLDAPLLVVVGGSTGAGKSTLVNSFVRAPVSPAGVLRPTTRTPVLVCNPADTQWFRRGELLPGLTRTTEATTDPNSLHIVSAPALTPGLAFLDAPDIDSVVDANRALAAQLLAAADLWLFVTTASRYADAVPWELLQTARFRGTVTALVLDRVPPEATEEVTAHLLEMLSIYGLHTAPLFVLPETDVDGQGLLPEGVTAPLREWFERIATDAATRAAVVRQTLDGALAALVPAVEGLAAAADEQVTTADALDDRVRAAYRTGRRTISQGVQDGRLMRGEVLARWQEFVGTGELLRTLEARVGRLRDRVVAAFTGRPQPGRELKSAIEANLVTLIRGAAADAADSAYTGWQAHPAGAALLEPSLGRPSPDLAERAERLVRDWQRGVLELIRKEAGHKRATARGAAYAVNATGLLVMVGVFASTAFIPTGAEVAVAGGTTVAAQKVLEAIFGDQAIRALATKAREDLISRTNALLDLEAGRYTDRLVAAGISADPGKDLRDAAALVEYMRAKAELTSGTGLTLPGVDG
jgi:chemotaxis protein histidine kinase CheA